MSLSLLRKVVWLAALLLVGCVSESSVDCKISPIPGPAIGATDCYVPSK